MLVLPANSALCSWLVYPKFIFIACITLCRSRQFCKLGNTTEKGNIKKQFKSRGKLLQRCNN